MSGEETVEPNGRKRRPSIAEIVAAVGLIAGGVAWLTNISVTAGALSSRFSAVEAGADEQRRQSDRLRDTIGDVRERLIRIETLLSARADGVKVVDGGR